MPIPPEAPDPDSSPPWKITQPLKRFWARDSRDHLWDFLDHLDEKPAFKKILFIGVPILVLAAGLGFFGYQHWARTNSLRIARQWLDANRLDQAGTAIRTAIEAEPELPASWRLASELAWKKGNRSASIGFAKKAALVGGYEDDDVLAWSEASILADDLEQAHEAWTHLEAATIESSPRALRLAGEIARRSLRFSEARDRFMAALSADRLAGAESLAVDEIPLGIVSLQTDSAADRSRGQKLLTQWASDRNWGANALRALLADSSAHGEREATARWAEGLRLHPRCAVGDVPVCLQALAGSDPVRYQAMLSQLEERGRATPAKAAELLGWLNQISQSAEAFRWSQTLDPAGARRAPVVTGVAESLRALGRWPELEAWVERADWRGNVEFLGWAYGLVAARQRGNEAKADSDWKKLQSDSALTPAHALFVGDTLYAWGYPKEAAELLWTAANRPDLAYLAVGTLARLYQMQRDAAGQYRAFSRLHAMRLSDRKIANNLAYFAVITTSVSQQNIEQLAEDNFAHEPGNLTYRSTLALVLVWSGQVARALKLLEPVSHAWKESPAVAFAYGAALAGSGRKPEAATVFASLNPANLSAQEIEWIRATML